MYTNKGDNNMIITKTYRITTPLNGSLDIMKVTLKDGIAWLIKPELPKSVYLDNLFFQEFDGLLIDRYDETLEDVIESMNDKVLKDMEQSL